MKMRDAVIGSHDSVGAWMNRSEAVADPDPEIIDGGRIAVLGGGCNFLFIS